MDYRIMDTITMIYQFKLMENKWEFLLIMLNSKTEQILERVVLKQL